MRKRKPWKFIFILLFAVAISLGVYVYQQQYEPDDLFVKVGEGILDNAPEIFSRRAERSPGTAEAGGGRYRHTGTAPGILFWSVE